MVDGLGGTVKRSVWRHVRSEHAHITNPEEYASVAKERNPSITFFLKMSLIHRSRAWMHTGKGCWLFHRHNRSIALNPLVEIS